MDLREPLHIRHALQARNDQPQRRALMFRKRFTIERPRQERLIRHRLLSCKTPSELLVEFVLLRSKLHFFLTMIGAKENKLARYGLHTRGIENRLEWNSRPAAVSRQPLQWPSIARTFKSGDEFRVPHLFQLVERQCLWTLY